MEQEKVEEWELEKEEEGKKEKNMMRNRKKKRKETEQVLGGRKRKRGIDQFNREPRRKTDDCKIAIWKEGRMRGRKS